jgi:hypothetical protein
MNKSSERIVIFVTPAQKLAIATSAQRLGISVSELMRRAVLAFDDTGDQVKAASLVDRLRAPQAPNVLNETLRRVAQAATPAAPRYAAPAATAGNGDEAAPPAASLGASVVRALAEADDDHRITQEAVARVTAKKAAEQAKPRARAAVLKTRIGADPAGAEFAADAASSDAAGPAADDGSFA